MYERVKALPNPVPNPYVTNLDYDSAGFLRTAMISGTSGASKTPEQCIFQKPWNETPQCLIYIHGYNNSDEDYMNRSEIMFKRLWWQGYKGRLVGFRWASDLSMVGGFNTGEYRAWKYGKSLKDYFDDPDKGQKVKLSPPKVPEAYTFSIAAHSQGNVVACSALKRGLTVDNYLMMQAAIPAG